jgi:hypothetical protein
MTRRRRTIPVPTVPTVDLDAEGRIVATGVPVGALPDKPRIRFASPGYRSLLEDVDRAASRIAGRIS